MRFLDYGIAAVVESIFFIGIACLIGMGITEMINRKPKRPNVMYKVGGSGTRTTSATHIDQWRARPATTPNYRQPRYGLLERLRAMYYGHRIDRLAASIERQLERKQRRAARWQERNRLI